ncbi:MAG: tRNA preQ1(34) S-adenosylmethionine ribosyltransferase-isomerase QueA [Candidatus Gracilibacteria bacterium]|nr:tRNA preQ1(34) S-adenosylmethionine ribosyltransferase-isomerase QueA [Candidatus Gracilibacteria bacterium]MDD2908957.1 tRNA preQ1(34) S-adenosylmethionine ribosyltransferase-isomerase QueA [Candidatus Gracilibacteria bacterium]
MRTSDFHYNLDPKNIAQFPASPRDSSKLMIIDRKTGNLEERNFCDIVDYLGENDVLVFNETKVIKARLNGLIILNKGKEKEVEIFLLSQKGQNTWECAVFPGERLKIGREIFFLNSNLKGIIKEITYSGRIIEFNLEGVEFLDEIDRIGSIPLPPYIVKGEQTLDQYNTIFAKEEGSAAAPTAGLHFTEGLIEKLVKKGVKIEKVLLHIGLGTFKPVQKENIEEHIIHYEHIEINEETADKLNKYKQEGKNIIAVGTTVIRTLESMTDMNGILNSGEKETNIFIYPGYNFKFINNIITNFHLPESSLIMLISAFYDREKLLEIYEYAQNNNYRFFSFGDAMFLR